MPLDKGTDHKRAHAVAQQMAGKLRQGIADPTVYYQRIIDHRLPAAGMKIAEVAVLHGHGAVSAVVVNHAGIAFPGHELHEGKVAFLVFAHTVYKLQDASAGNIRWHHLEDGKLQSVG